MVKSSDIFENDCILLVCGWRYNMSDVLVVMLIELAWFVRSTDGCGRCSGLWQKFTDSGTAWRNDVLSWNDLVEAVSVISLL